MTASYAEVILVSFVLILPFLYETSDKVRYYLRFSFYYGFVMFNALLLIPIMALKPGDVRNLPLASIMCKPVTTVLGMKWQLKGKEFLEKEQACIIVANHQSSIDILGMLDIWPIMEKCTAVARKEVFYVWPFGIAAWLCGLIFIDRVNPEKARQKLREATDYIKANKIKLWVFPEGTRRNTGDIHPFKKGAFHMAIQAQIPILPVVFSSYYFLDSKKKHFDQVDGVRVGQVDYTRNFDRRKGKVIITTLPPIPTEGLTVANIDELIETTRKVMLEAFHSSNKEIRDKQIVSTPKV